MTDDIDFQDLFAEFPELSDQEAIFEKEILAHFGLLFSAFANLETGLQMCFTFTSLEAGVKAGAITSQREWLRLNDEFEARAHRSTFGTLLKLTADIEWTEKQQNELHALKRARDYFAHHFFREENHHMLSPEGLLHLMSNMQKLRQRVDAFSKVIEETYGRFLSELYPTEKLEERLEEIMTILRQEVEIDPKRPPGWEVSSSKE